MNINTTPSQEEFFGSYNVPVNKKIKGQLYLSTIKNPPPLDLIEVKNISLRVYSIIHTYAAQKNYNENELRKYYDQCVSEDISDRTLSISFINPNDCTVNLINELQKFLEYFFPLWRIRISGSSPKTTIIIYPKTIRFGSINSCVSQEIAFAEILQKEIEILDNSPVNFSIQNKQYNSLKIILKSILPIEENDRPVIFEKFDNYKGDFSKVTFWTLCTNQIASLEIVSPSGAMAGDHFYVKDDGDFGYHVDDKAKYWIREWIFPSDKIPDKLVFKKYNPEYHATQTQIHTNTILAK